MNQSRRRQVDRLVTALEALRDDLDTILLEEREAFDAMSENAQQGERGQASEAAIDNLQQAYDDLDGVVATLGTVVEP